MSRLRLEALTKHYGGVSGVHNVTLEIESGEFFSFLGPSGCGKTTLLRLIAGLELPSSGKIFIDGVDVTNRTPQRRDTVMVFQNYALFPHMSVQKNVSFGLEVKKLMRGEMRSRVLETLALVKLEHKVDSPIQDLSGGEQQRVALARAIAVRPKILLMDEPLSNLDITLRAETRAEIKRLQQTTGITTVYVTHDQEEALGISDRLAVLHRGRVEQVGTPMEVYEQPKSAFVASFLGNANLVKGRVSAIDGRTSRVVVNDEFQFSVCLPPGFRTGGSALIELRPENIRLVPVNEPHDFKARIEASEFQGLTVEFTVRVGGELLRVVGDPDAVRFPKWNQQVGVKVDARRCFVYPADGGVYPDVES